MPSNIPHTIRPTGSTMILAIIGAVFVLAAANIATAAYISEVFFDQGSGETGMPNAVEITGLDMLASVEVDLVVIDARFDSLGSIRQIITIPTANRVTLVSDRDWPSDLWGSATALGPDRVTLEQLGYNESFNFVSARSLMLYDRSTRLQNEPTHNIFSDEQQDRLDDASLIDAVTFINGIGMVDPDAPGEVFEVGPGHAMVRPMLADGSASSSFIAAEISDKGTLMGTDPPLAVTPGVNNPWWVPIPEPGSATIMLTTLTALLAWPRRRAVRAGG